MPPSPPTRDLGRPDLIWGIAGQGLMSDWLETTADLMWPLSVRTYGRMRHDPQLKAIIQAYTLPIRRATWMLDPRGCRDEVVQQVADDLGLPILGVDAEPGPARRRGVNWGEHLRLALLHLVYGHMPFERRYEIVGDRARLVNLGERMPHTITEIAVNNDGTVRHIRQEPTGIIDIPARRLVWYVHEREGANWAGQSVFRPAWGAWLLKHEVWRVHATSIRRFGMGVPTVTAPPGATPAQVLEAQRLASAIRAGDQAGAGLPHGFTWELAGMKGSAPDALAYIRYLDQQMSTMALAGLLDLGSTPNGSRALGDNFLDLFLLSLQAVADHIAQTATTGHPGMPGIVTDLVDLNWGDTEPAPRVVCTDVGERHDLTVEAINGLIQSGALTADADLEAYLRGTYRLPPRAQEGAASGRSYEYDLNYGILTIDERRAQIGLPPLPGGQGNVLPEPANVRSEPDPAPPPQPAPSVTARAGRRRRTRRATSIRAAGDDDAGHRQLTTIEAASGMDPDAVQDDWQTALDQLIEDWADLSAAQREEALEQIAAAVNADDIEALEEVAIESDASAAVLAAAMVALAITSAKRMTQEATSQGITVRQPPVEEDRLTSTAAVVSGVIASGLAAAAVREALRVWTPGRSADDVTAQVRAHLESLTDTWLREQLGGAMSAAQNTGRIAVLRAAPPAQYVASEILDRNTCTDCVEIDGTTFETLTDAETAYSAGGYIKCQGRLRCRGIVIAVWED